MKKPTRLIKLLSLLVVSSLLYYSCQQDNAIEFFEEETYQEKIETYEKRIANLEEQLAEQPPRIERPNNIIDFRDAREMFKNYDDRANLISETLTVAQDVNTFEPTRSLFYEISELENYLSYIKDLSKKSGVTPSGIRFYFAIYSDNHISSDGSDRNAGRQTIFIAPTLRQNNGRHIGYTLDNNQKVKLLNDRTGFYHMRTNRNKNTHEITRQIEDDKFSLIANSFGASPPIGHH